MTQSKQLKSSATNGGVNGFLWYQLQFQAASQERSFAIWYMIVCLAYFGLALVLFAMTSRGDVDAFYLPFHYSEFFGALIFNSAEAAMVYFTMLDSNSLFLGDNRSTGKENHHRMQNRETEADSSSDTTASEENGTGGALFESIPALHWSQSAALALISLNVVASAIAAVLFSMSPETFEVHAHWIEYSVQITVTLVNTIFITKQGQQLAAGTGSRCESSNKKNILVSSRLQMLLAYVLLLMAIFKMLLYGEAIETKMGGERSSHFLEFIGEMFNSAWAFVFTLHLYRTLTEKQQDLSRKMRSILAGEGREDDEENPLILNLQTR